MRDDLPELLASVPMLASLDVETRGQLAQRAERVAVEAGQWLFHEGDRGDGMYLVASGRIDVVLEDAEQTLVRELAAGDWLGELALLTDQRRSASARARRDSVLIRIAAEDFAAAIEDQAVASALLRYLAGQLQRSRGLYDATRRTPTMIALIPMTEDLPVDRVVSALAAELRRSRPAEVLRVYPGESPPEVTGVIDRVERNGGQVLAIADPRVDGGAWASACLRQADAVVLLGGTAAPPGALPAVAPDDRVDVHLMLPGPALDDEQVATAWLNGMPRATVTRVDELDTAAAAVARRLGRRSVGVVLSGGGARGFAHVGALAELVEQGVVIDRVGGVSMGAVVAGLFASGRNPDELTELLRQAFVYGRPLGDYTLPIYAFVRGGRGQREFTRLFEDRRIETLPREFFCAACDIYTSSFVVKRRGPMAIAIGASAALPGITPPVVDEAGRVLVDGGVLNNLPVEEMAKSSQGPVIAVDVTAIQPEEPPRLGRFRRARLRRATELARRAVVAIDGPLPRGPETVFRSIVLGSEDTAAAARRYAALTIAPSVQDIGISDFEAIDEMVARGRAAAREALAVAPPELWPPGS
ncbi:MAG: cyclic nucleotide-binding domain-containing protein [Solirubrobacterales bacterium]|nr:cyclic nucleotide-binding domain-containing protein [Solirubrobacterales bacterium]